MNITRLLSLFLSGFAVLMAFDSYSADSRHQFYVDGGYNFIDNTKSTEKAWTTTLGYSFFLSPFLGFDLGYTDTFSDGASFSDPNSNNLDFKYRSYFAGARVEQPINRYSSIFARGGVGQTNIEETNLSVAPEVTKDNSRITPYLGIGAKMQPLLIDNLELSVELKYQDLQKDYSATSLSLGARFSL